MLSTLCPSLSLAELSHGGVGVGGGEGFTPGTVDGGLNWPVRGTKSVRGEEGRIITQGYCYSDTQAPLLSLCCARDQKNAFVTKLSFSEADSLSRSTSRLDSTTDGRSAAATHSGFFSATLDCEKRVSKKDRGMARGRLVYTTYICMYICESGITMLYLSFSGQVD